MSFLKDGLYPLPLSLVAGRFRGNPQTFHLDHRRPATDPFLSFSP